MPRNIDEPERTASGRHVTPLGIRTGGKAWLQIHSAISTAALEVLAETGWGLFTVDAVAQRAGVSKRTVYRHFPDKEALAVAGIRVLPTFHGWGKGNGTIKERIKKEVTRAGLFPRYLTPIMSTCLVHRDDVPALLDTLTTHVLEPRARAFDELLKDVRSAGIAREGVEGYQVDALVNGLLAAEYRGVATMNTPAKRAAVFTETIWRFISK